MKLTRFKQRQTNTDFAVLYALGFHVGWTWASWVLGEMTEKSDIIHRVCLGKPSHDFRDGFKNGYQGKMDRKTRRQLVPRT